MKDIPKPYLIGGILVIVLLLVATVMFTRRPGQKADEKDEVAAEEEIEVIPTVDGSVKVNVEAMNGKRDVMLTVSGIPDGTESIEYIISYETVEQGLQGLNGIVSLESGEKEFEKSIKVGTCSSGTCVYHEVTSDMKVELKFEGSYGERVFQKEFAFE